MRLYHAGSSTHLLYRCGVRRALVAFSDVGSAPFRFWLGEAPEGRDVFLDSGAYAAHRGGAAIGLPEYCEFVAEHAAQLSAYAALDVIGDWRATAANTDAMLARGLRPVPVWHLGSPAAELERLAREHGYVGVGGIMPPSGQKLHRKTREFLQPQLDAVFRALRPLWPVRVHLFGVAQQWVLERYPAYSADSATVVLGAALGTYARFLRGTVRWKYWWEDVPETLDGALGEVGGTAKAAARQARWETSARSMMRLERHVTDVWAMRGVTWQ